MTPAAPFEMTEIRRSYARSLVRPWRLAFICFFVALMIGTHWPRLTFAPEIPATDKTIHFLAFAALTVLLLRTRWVPPLAAFALVLAYAVLDEITQGIPILGRTVTGHDITANLLGVVTVGLWFLALRPMGGVINRRRLRTENHAFDRVFLRRRLWFRLTASAGLVAMIILIAIWGRMPGGPAVILAAIAAAGMVIVIDLFVAWQRERREIASEALCLDCGRSCRAATVDAHGRGTCPVCRSNVHRGQWVYVAPQMKPDRRARRVWRTWMFGVVGLAVAMLIFVALAPIAYGALLRTNLGSNATRFVRRLGSLPDSLTRTADLAVILWLFAFLTWRSRRWIAREHDQSIECRRCGHDLHATPIAGGVGHCGECGAAFLRTEETETELA